jgi:hypothetical protein
MNSSDFLSALNMAMPSREELEAYGLSSNEIDGVQGSFRFIERNPSGISLASRSEAERMIVEFDCSALEVGLVRFLDRPREHRHGVQVAFCETDPIVVCPDGTVAMYDHANADKAVNCAADSEHFLDGLSVFLTVRREKAKWKGRAQEAAALCANKAGGLLYMEFFRLLCGFIGGGVHKGS